MYDDVLSTFGLDSHPYPHPHPYPYPPSYSHDFTLDPRPARPSPVPSTLTLTLALAFHPVDVTHNLRPQPSPLSFPLPLPNVMCMYVHDVRVYMGPLCEMPITHKKQPDAQTNTSTGPAHPDGAGAAANMGNTPDPYANFDTPRRSTRIVPCAHAVRLARPKHARRARSINSTSGMRCDALRCFSVLTCFAIMVL